ncbi:hypothetical protein SAMN04488490_2699 [Marinobacter sp. LV10R510-11A]|nr:hypothetical protein SAMN04488490_2699 [Marinobacter sp. LV10R510-11A]
MLLSEAKCNRASTVKPQGMGHSPAVADLQHADKHSVRNSGDPGHTSTLSLWRPYGEGQYEPAKLIVAL